MDDRIVVWQPVYFPKLHYLARIQDADVFVIFDSAEFSRQSRQHRTQIEYREVDWLTIPVHHDGTVRIKNARIDMAKHWGKKHLKTLQVKYGGTAPSPYEPLYDALTNDARLTDIVIPTLLKTIDLFDIDIDIYLSSRIELEYKKGDASNYLARLTENFNCDTYYCGKNAYESYLDDAPFNQRDIEIGIQDWESSWPEGNVNCLDVIYQAENPTEYIK